MRLLCILVLGFTLVSADDRDLNSVKVDNVHGEKEDPTWYYISFAVLFGVVIVFLAVVVCLCNIRNIMDRCVRIRDSVRSTTENCVPHSVDNSYKYLTPPEYSSSFEPDLYLTKDVQQDLKTKTQSLT